MSVEKAVLRSSVLVTTIAKRLTKLCRLGRVLVQGSDAPMAFVQPR